MLPRHVYVHVPFCARRCSYCDFAIAVRRRVPVETYVARLAGELALRAPAPPWEVDTVYLGGGTPSRLGGAGVAQLLAALAARLTLAPGAEVTLEANPEDVTEASAAAWRAAGVTRVSLGAQSFQEAALRWMHRVHDAERVAAAVQCIRGAGIREVSLDLIFALPAHLERDWSADLDRALSLAPTHISLYGLTVETGTPLERWRARGQVVEGPEEQYEHEYLLAHERLARAGFEHYEVSNFALPGSRARHNAAYWRRVPYLGLGPSAHSFDGVERRWNLAQFVAWERALGSGRDPVDGREVLSETSRRAEEAYLGLRTAEGLELDRAAVSLARPWVEAGWGNFRGDRLRLTPRGWLRLDALASALTLVESHY